MQCVALSIIKMSEILCRKVVGSRNNHINDISRLKRALSQPEYVSACRESWRREEGGKKVQWVRALVVTPDDLGLFDSLEPICCREPYPESCPDSHMFSHSTH